MDARPDTFADLRLAQLLDTLRRRGRRLTPQRAAILSALVRHTGHPTVDELHRLILPEFPTTSLATVYKTIALLKEHGEVLELGADGPGCRYDGRRPRPHPHLVCTRCGRISDPEEPGGTPNGPGGGKGGHGATETAEDALRQLVDRLAAQSGHRVDAVRLDLFGLCPNCQ